MRPGCVDRRGSLANEHLAGAVQYQHTLLLGRLDRDEAHRRSGHRLADRLGVGRVVLLDLHIRSVASGERGARTYIGFDNFGGGVGAGVVDDQDAPCDLTRLDSTASRQVARL
jgi:hypothetical protein